MLRLPKDESHHECCDYTASRSYPSESPIPSKRCRLDYSWGLTGFRVPLKPLQVSADVGGMLVPKVPILLQAFVDNPFQFCWQIRVQPHCRCWRAIKNCFENNARALSAKRQRTCCHFVKHSTKGKQVRSCVQFLGSDLLWRHIGNGSNSRSRTGQMLGTRFY